jgi:hypothetical protein
MNKKLNIEFNDNLSLTQSAVNNWMTEWANLHLKNEPSTNTVIGSQSNETFQNFFPIAMKVAAKPIGIDLVNIQPIGGLTSEDYERIYREVATINRERKIESIIEDKEFKEFKEEEHELSIKKKSPFGNLFYMDVCYATTSTPIQYSSPINKRGKIVKKKRT